MVFLWLGIQGFGSRREEGRDKKGGYRWRRRGRVEQRRLWPPVHPLVALNDLFDLLFSDLLYIVSVIVLASLLLENALALPR
jgi:hypothetical protein